MQAWKQQGEGGGRQVVGRCVCAKAAGVCREAGMFSGQVEEDEMLFMI